MTQTPAQDSARWWQQPPPPQPASSYAPYLTDLAAMPDTPPVEPTRPEPRRTNHVLHLLITLVLGAFTYGVGALVWLLVWAMLAANNRTLNRGQVDWYEQARSDYTRARWRWEQRHRAR